MLKFIVSLLTATFVLFLGNAFAQDQSVGDLLRAANQGDIDAEFALGKAYEFGYGVEKNLDQAIFWFSKADAQGSKDAAGQIRFCYEDIAYAAEQRRDRPAQLRASLQSLYWLRKKFSLNPQANSQSLINVYSESVAEAFNYAGVESNDRGDFEAALLSFEQALQYNPNNYDASRALQSKINRNIEITRNNQAKSNGGSGSGDRTFRDFLGSLAQGFNAGMAARSATSVGGSGNGNTDLCRQLLNNANQCRQSQNDMSSVGATGGGKVGQAGAQNDCYNLNIRAYNAQCR